MLTKSSCIVLLLAPILFTCTMISTAVYSLYSSGKSKTWRKKMSRKMKWWAKVSLTGYAKECHANLRAAKALCICWIGYWIIVLICIFLLAASSHFPEIDNIFVFTALFKTFLVDLPVNGAAFFLLRHDKKHGGVKWVWEKD